LDRSQNSFVSVLLLTVALASVWCTGYGKDRPDTSKMLVVSNGVMVVDTREKIQFDAPDYNNYLQELNRAAEKGADSKFTLHVTDQDGKEVADAEIDVLFPFNGRKGNTLSGKTDIHGLFSVEDKTTGEPSFIVMKKGYYRTSSKFGVLKIGTRCLQKGRWIPWSPTFQVTLKEIRKPIPMIAKKVEFKLPEKAQPMGFDFLVGDWVPPHGKGITADMIYLYEEERKDRENYDLKLSVAFPGMDNGCYVKRKDEFSSFMSIHEAQPDNYASNMVWRIYRKDGQYVTREKLTKSDYLVFRTRSRHDDRGNIVSAHYGKIYGPIEGPNGLDRMTFFTYYFNPTPNDRNLEFDGKNNLMKGLSSLEEVYTQ